MKNYLSIALLLTALGLAIAAAVLLADFGAFNAADDADAAAADQELTPEQIEELFAAQLQRVEELKKANPFYPPPPPPQPPTVQGILGSMAFMNGKWVKVGDDVNGAKVLAIEATYVKIEWQGEEKILAPIQAATNSSGPKAKPKDRKKGKGPKKQVQVAQAAGGPAVAMGPAPAAAGDDDPLAWMGVEISDKLRGFIMMQWENATDEQKEQAKEHWNNMSDEEKEEQIAKMEAQIEMMP